MKKLYWPLAFGCWLLVSLCAFAQTTPEKRITANFNNSTFEQFVKEAETQTGVYFYYQASLLDSLKITLNAQNQPLVGILVQVFKGTDFKFAIDDASRVFVTTDQAIITELPNHLFEKNNNNEDDAKNLYIAPTDDEQDKLLSTAESKVYNMAPKRSASSKENPRSQATLEMLKRVSLSLGLQSILSHLLLVLLPTHSGFSRSHCPVANIPSKSKVLVCATLIANWCYLAMAN